MTLFRSHQLLKILTNHHPDLGPDFLRRFRAGEEKAFDQLFRAFFTPLAFYAYRLLDDDTSADDLVQDCFVELWQRRHKLENIQSIKAYLYRCVHNKALNYIKSKKIKTSALAKELENIPDEEEVMRAEIISRLLEVIDHLPARMKEVMRMHYLEGKSLEEIGAAIGIDPETARSHRYRAIQLVRKTIITT
jgi:RNA polymerase sigma-70 factor (ECF subfamily)